MDILFTFTSTQAGTSPSLPNSLVEVKLWAHQDESKHVDSPDQAAQNPAVPRLVIVVHERVNRIANDQGIQDVAEVASGLLVILLGLGLGVGDPGENKQPDR